MRQLLYAYDRMLDVLGLIVGAIILSAVFAVTMDVVARYVFGSSIAWVFEITEYALLYVPCLGMAWVAREGGHVAIDSFVNYLPENSKQMLTQVTNCICAVVCAVTAYYGAELLWQRYNLGASYEQILTVPEYLVLWVIPFGFGLTSFEFIRGILWPATRPARQMVAGL